MNLTVTHAIPAARKNVPRLNCFIFTLYWAPGVLALTTVHKASYTFYLHAVCYIYDDGGGR